MSYSFLCTDILPPWLNLFLILFFLMLLHLGLFYFLSLIVHCYYTEIELIFKILIL